MMSAMDPTQAPEPPASESTPTVEALAARVRELEAERDATERRVVAALAGELVALARHARAEYAQRLARGDGGGANQRLVHHAEAFEYVAVELARKFGGEVAEAVTPTGPAPVEASEPAAPVEA